jgi:serine O-acetyltransferase
VGVPAQVVKVGGVRVCPANDLDQIHIPDPIQQEIDKLEEKLHELRCLSVKSTKDPS